MCLARVPHFQWTDEIQACFCACTESLVMITNEPELLIQVITTNESWINHYDPLLKNESSIWLHQNESQLKKVQQRRSAGKVMLIAFFDCKSMIYQHHYLLVTWVNTFWSSLNFASTSEENIQNWSLLDTPSRQCTSPSYSLSARIPGET